MPSGAERGAAEQLDRVAELLREGDVVAVERVDALVRHLIDADVGMERDRREDRDLRGGIGAVHVLRGVGLRVAELLGARERLGVALALLRHRRQDEVGRAVDDADDLAHARGEHRLAQHLDDRDGGAHGGLEAELRAVALGDAPQLLAVAGQQLLVRGDDRDAAARGARRCSARVGSMPPMTSATTETRGSSRSSSKLSVRRPSRGRPGTLRGPRRARARAPPRRDGRRRERCPRRARRAARRPSCRPCRIRAGRCRPGSRASSCCHGA